MEDVLHIHLHLPFAENLDDLAREGVKNAKQSGVKVSQVGPCCGCDMIPL